MRIAQLLAQKGDFVATVPSATAVGELIELLARHGVGAMVVSDDGRRIQGIVSERDVVRAMAARGGSMLESPVSEIMTEQVFCTTSDASVENLMRLMTEQRVRHVPVVDAEESLVGIVSIGDVVKNRMGELEDERAALVEYITTGR